MINKIGKHTYIDSNNLEVNFYPNDYQNRTYNHKVEIGSFCSIAKNVKIFMGGNHRPEWISTFPFGFIDKHIFNKFSGDGVSITKGDVIIGNDVWVGANTTIMSNIRIGDGAIIANNSHVVKDVEPYTIVGGNPAKVIKKRFSDEIIDKLLKLKWWEFEDSEINKISHILCSDNFDELFRIYNI
jgi:acetyltransferase-like isoleucine patch superfamily enzyme